MLFACFVLLCEMFFFSEWNATHSLRVVFAHDNWSLISRVDVYTLTIVQLSFSLWDIVLLYIKLYVPESAF